MINEITYVSNQGDGVSRILRQLVHIPVFLWVVLRVNEVTLTPVLGVWDKLVIEWLQVRNSLKVLLEHHFLYYCNTVPVGMSTIRPVNITRVLVSKICNYGVFSGKSFAEVIIQQLGISLDVCHVF